MRGIANDPNQNGGYPEFLANVVGANGSVVSDGPAPLDQPRIYFGPVISNTSADYAIVGTNGADREYDYETNTETKNYTYTGLGGVPIGGWISRSVFAAKFAERNFLFSNVIGSNSKILFNRDPAQRVEAVAPWLTTDSAVYPAIVNKRLVWIIDGYTTLDNYPYSELTSLESATADSTEVAFNRLAPDKQVSYIRNSVKATVDAYDGTVTLYQQDEQDPVLKAWMQVFPGTVKPKSDITPELAEHLRYPEDLFKVQRMLLAKYHVNDPVTFFSTSDFWDVPLDPNPTASSYQPPYYIVAKNIAKNDNSASYPVDQRDEQVQARLPGRLHQRQLRSGDVRQDHRADHPGPGQRAETGQQRDHHRSGGVPGPRRDRARQPEPDPVGQPAHAAGGPGRAALCRTRLRLPGSQRRRVVVPAADPGGDDVQRQDRVRPDRR